MENQNVPSKMELTELHAMFKNEFRQLIKNSSLDYPEDGDHWIQVFEKWLDSFETIEDGKLSLHKALVYLMMQRTQVLSRTQQIELLNKSIQLIDEYKQTNNLGNSDWLIVGMIPDKIEVTECLVDQWLAEVYHYENIEKTIFWTERALQIIENKYGRNSKEFAACLKDTPLLGKNYVDFVEKWADYSSSIKEYSSVWLNVATNILLSNIDTQEENILKTQQKIQYLEKALSIDSSLADGCKRTLAELKQCLQNII